MALSKTSWKKGYCPNPGGRIGGLTEIRDKALSLSLKGLGFLEQVIFNENEPTRNRLTALNMALDRALGRPAQAIQIQESNDLKTLRPENLTGQELEMLVFGKAENLLKSYLETKTQDQIALLLESQSEKVLAALQKPKKIHTE